jgi:hypothetical protein
LQRRFLREREKRRFASGSPSLLLRQPTQIFVHAFLVDAQSSGGREMGSAGHDPARRLDIGVDGGFDFLVEH